LQDKFDNLLNDDTGTIHANIGTYVDFHCRRAASFLQLIPGSQFSHVCHLGHSNIWIVFHVEAEENSQRLKMQLAQNYFQNRRMRYPIWLLTRVKRLYEFSRFWI
jgi:hypothetical protein